MKSIITVTLNAAVDTTLVLSKPLEVGASQTAAAVLRSPGGKGINVARVLRTLGAPVQATGLIGGPAGAFIADGVAAAGINAAFLPITGASRTNVALVEKQDSGAYDPHVTEVNEPGPMVTPEEAARFLDHVDALLPNAAALVLSGSLPPGLPDNYYALLIDRARSYGVPAFLDTSGRGAAPGLAAGPLLIAPNRTEANALTGSPVVDIPSALMAAGALRRAGTSAAAITLGADGAVLACASGAWHAHVAVAHAVSAVGSGDAFLAGLIAGLTRAGASRSLAGLEATLAYPDAVADALRLAIACGAANTLHLGAGVVEHADITDLAERVALTSLVS